MSFLRGLESVTALAFDELVELFDSTEGDKLHPLWVLLGTAGLRIGEALWLMWSDFDFDVRQVVFSAASTGLPGRDGSSRRRRQTSRRTVVLTTFALRVLQENRLRAGDRPERCW